MFALCHHCCILLITYKNQANSDAKSILISHNLVRIGSLNTLALHYCCNHCALCIWWYIAEPNLIIVISFNCTKWSICSCRQKMDLPCSHPPNPPAVLSPSISHPRKRPFEKMCKMKRDEGEDWSALHLCKEGIAFLLFVREEINSIHIIKFWQGETLSADIEKWQECFKACLSSSSLLSFCIFSPQQNQTALSHLSLLPIIFFYLYSILFSVCLLWKGRGMNRFTYQLTPHKLLVLGDASLLFSRALW